MFSNQGNCVSFGSYYIASEMAIGSKIGLIQEKFQKIEKQNKIVHLANNRNKSNNVSVTRAWCVS